MQYREPLQGVFQFQQIDRRRGCRYAVHTHLPPTTAALLTASPPRFIHEDSSNGSRRGGEEVDTVRPCERIATHQFDVGFVRQLRGIPVSRILIAGQLPLGNLPQLLVDERGQFVGCGLVTAGDSLQDHGDRLGHSRGTFLASSSVLPLERKPSLDCANFVTL